MNSPREYHKRLARVDPREEVKPHEVVRIYSYLLGLVEIRYRVDTHTRSSVRCSDGEILESTPIVSLHLS